MNIKSKLSLCLGAIMLTACSNNDIAETLELVDGNQTIIVKVSGAKSRAGRELLSSESGQAIENVKIILTDDKGTVVWTKLLDAWNSNDSTLPLQSSATNDGRIAEIEVPKDEFRMLGGATYYAYSYGYSNGSDYDLNDVKELKVGDVLSADLTVKLLSNSVTGEEIFAGSCTIVGDIKGVRVELVLNRQVAGTYAYLTNIPYVYDNQGHVGTYLILTASNPQSALALGNFDNAGNCSEYKGKYVVNGFDSKTEDVIYTIDLTKWFDKIEPALDEDGRSIGMIKKNDNWIGDSKKYKNGSVFAGKFIIPFAKNEDPTLQLKLCWDNNPANAMRTWNVILPEDAAQLTQYDYIQYAAGAWSTVKQADTETVYNILRNHLYAIGTKDSAVLPTEPANPEDPINPDDPQDDPEPINNKQELNVVVNHNWGAIYTMGIE